MLPVDSMPEEEIVNLPNFDISFTGEEIVEE